ncbi:homoserine kinase [Flammeovirgaceae bacterium SG7u.111]|nr:homoserine kinase [Flammeovirgaceae bacterium SG7u.132]WPO35324.1 homoserine kinase [Flammeovirgaceae bacterium SG7u.111]
MSESVKVFSPATVANVACGFDILGLSLQYPGDEIVVRKTDTPGIKIINSTEYKEIPENPLKNTASVAMQAFLDHLGSEQGFEMEILKKIKPGSGIGSSAASSAAGVFAANHLLGSPLSRKELVQFAMAGEAAACGSPHADNVAPALLGGFALIRSYNPLDVVTLPYPEDLYCTIIHPQIEVKTADARRILRKEIALKDAVVQWGNIAGLVAGLFNSDYELIGRSLEDVVIEPIRSILIPGYEDAKKAAIEAGALGCSISGSGPSMFSLSKSEEAAKATSDAIQAVFEKLDIETNNYISKINPVGISIIS